MAIHALEAGLTIAVAAGIGMVASHIDVLRPGPLWSESIPPRSVAVSSHPAAGDDLADLTRGVDWDHMPVEALSPTF